MLTFGQGVTYLTRKFVLIPIDLHLYGKVIFQMQSNFFMKKRTKLAIVTVTTILNPAPAQINLSTEMFQYTDILCPNETEVKRYVHVRH